MRRVTNSMTAMTRGLVLVLALGFISAATAQPKSDFEIVKTFQTKYKAIKQAILNAKTVQDCAEISANIDELQKEYAADTTLLNKALYPDKYDDEIDGARVELRMAQDKLGIIETQVARIADLESQVRMLSGKVDSLSQENDKLMASLDVMSKAMEKNTKTIDSLKKIISQLRQGLRARDAAIFALVDSMFTQYGGNVQGLPDQQKRMLIGKVERHNVVTSILQSAEQNTKFLETTQLTGKDLVEMLKEQQKFSTHWKGVGPKLSSLYLNKRDREREVAAIDTAIAQWGRKADSSLWAGLYREFTDNNIPVDSFSNAGEFVSNLGEYFDTQGGDLKASGTERASRLNFFLKNVWNPSISTQWLPMLVNEGMVTKDQQASLQAKLTAWEEASKPSYTLLYIVILLIFIAVVTYFARRRKKVPPQFPSKN